MQITVLSAGAQNDGPTLGSRDWRMEWSKKAEDLQKIEEVP